MKHNQKTIMGVHAPAPRMTVTAAFLFAGSLAVPVFVVLTALAVVLK